MCRYYPDAEDVYKGAATVTADEDAQGLEEPIIAPVKAKTFSKLEKEVPGICYTCVCCRRVDCACFNTLQRSFFQRDRSMLL